MEEAGAAPLAEGSVGKAISDSTVDLDLMEELLSGDCWLDTANFSGFLQPSPLFSVNNSSSSAPREIEEERPEFSMNSPSNVNATELIRPRSQIIPLKERLFYALKHIKDAQGGSDILIQIWVPTRRGDKHFLTTRGQPFWFEPNTRSLDRYRSVSVEYEFSAEANSNELVGLPGRVFLGKVPEWTPDVRYFSVEEYPRVDQAQQLSVSGTIALPVFERYGRSCIGVVEVVSTRQKINYSFDVESICNALQAVDLRSSDVLRVPRVKVSDNSYQAALPEIREVLKSVCETHSLPLAQTWIACIQQGKQGSRHSSENYKECVSTIDDACYVNDPSMLGFHEACSEHHLFRGQGVAGKAFTTNQPCFSPDITSFMKAQYPLSHYAKLFNLQAAVAIRLRSIHTGSIDFVLEFFLPFNCIKSDQQKQMLNSLSITIQHVCQSLRVVTIKELDEEVMLHSDYLFDESPHEGGKRQGDTNLLPSWVPSVVEVQQMEESSAHPSSEHIGFSKQETFAVSSEWGASESVLSEGRIFSGFKNDSQNTADQKDSCPSGPNCQRAGKSVEKRRTKTEKTVSLEVLRQYFAGSLKDAAKSIGVCPTTLKRICRHHGITRWPSRKIKKVGHSLKKLQGVIDSVQGAEGTFQFSSVYENFTKAPENFTINQTDYPATSNTFQQKDGSFSPHSSGSNSSSSTCSLSSSSSLGCSAGSKQSHLAPQFAIKQEAPVAESRAVKLVRANSEAEAHFRSQELQRSLIRSQSYEVLLDHPFPKNPFQLMKRSNLLKVKAVYGEEKIRFRLQPSWGFQELKQEIVRRFNISDIFSVDLKYFDDESEWVLLTCDADLQECVDVYKSSSVDTVKISVHQVAVPVSRASFP